MAQVVGHLSLDELQAGYRGSGDGTLARHYQVIWLLAQGRTCPEVAGLTSFALRWVEQLLARYNAFGPRSLGDRRRGNGAAPTVLTPAMLAAVRERVRRPPDDGGVWTAKKVAAFMARRRRAARLGGAARDRLDDPEPAAAPRGGGDARGEAFKKACRGRRRGGGASPRGDDRDLRHRRASDRPEADPAPGLGAARRAPDRPGPPPLRVVPCHRLRLAATGESFWYLSTGVDKELFEGTLALFAREAGAGRDRIIILVLDGAGYHTLPLAVPEGLRLVYLPAYTPELQPAETLWVHVDEPIVNKHFGAIAEIDAVVAERCLALANDRDLIRGQAGFHWWPKRATRTHHPEMVSDTPIVMPPAVAS